MNGLSNGSRSCIMHVTLNNQSISVAKNQIGANEFVKINDLLMNFNKLNLISKSHEIEVKLYLTVNYARNMALNQ